MIQRWRISWAILDETQRALRRGHHEVFVLWTAAKTATGPDLPVTRCLVPAQQPGLTATGVYVHIDGAELSRVQIENYRRGERTVIQLHTHPGRDVRMSLLDREWEVVSHIGALSIIVPNYCTEGLADFPGVNVYERETKDWRLWPKAETRARLLIA